MTLREKILKTFVVTAREITRHGGMETFFEQYPVGALFYNQAEGPFDANGNELGTGISRERLARYQKAAKYRLITCADFAYMPNQIVPNFQESLAGIDDEELFYEYGKILGMQMNAHNVDWVLAPSVDLFMTDAMPLIASSNSPERIVKIYKNVIRGIQDQGVCATLKHFPGLGTHSVNMHHSPGRNILSMDQWTETFGYIYKELFKEQPQCVMTTHTMLEAYDNEKHDGYLPVATFSHKLTQGLLRNDLGFEGAVVTDAMIMGGNATGNYAMEAAQAFKCGADLILWPPVEAADIIEGKIKSGEIPESRLDEALGHIDKMMEFREKAVRDNKTSNVSMQYIDAVSKKLLENGICCYRNDIDLLPIDANKYKNILLIDATDSEGDISVTSLKAELEKRGMNVSVSREGYDHESVVCWPEDAVDIQKGADLVIFNFNTTGLNGWDNAFMNLWWSHMFDKSKKIIVNYGYPYYAENHFPEDPTFIQMNTQPSEYAAKALTERIFGERPFTGVSVLR